jgi:hypothetical protein
MALSDLIGVTLGSVLTLLVFSFLIRDNPLFRLTLSIFIGAAAGYGVALAFYTVIWPLLLLPLLVGPQAQRLLALPLLALAILLAFKISPRLARVGNPAMAFLVGVGAAAAIGGAVLGTLFSQVSATVNVFDQQATGGFANPGRLAEAALILLGTLATLIYFHFGARRSTPSPAMSAPAPAEGGEPAGAEAAPVQAPAPAALPPAGSAALQRPEWVESLAWVGELFIAVTFGVLFAGAFSASLAALIERTQSFVETFQYYLR